MVTNATPIAAYRGAGRPEATAAIERAVDLFAAEIGKDPADVRRMNLVPDGKFPYQSPCGPVYDSGAYTGALDQVLTGAGYRELRAEQARRRERGDVLQLGIGVSSYVEITAADAEGGETAQLIVHDNGTATVYTGSSAHGQGHHTAWAMLVEAELGIEMAKVTVIHGDTDLIPVGTGTYGSRSLQLGGVAVHKAAVEVKEQARLLAADLLEASESDLELDTGSGTWQVRGDPASSKTWAEVASHAGDGGLTASVNHAGQPTFPFGAHVAVVEVDTETGKARLIRHVTVDDAGTVLNPVLAEGQRHGGIAQGVAQALLRGGRLRRRRQPADQHAGGLRRDHRGRAAQLRAADQRDARRDQPARRQGHRRGRHDRLRPPPPRTPSSTRSATSASGTSTCRPHRNGSGPRSTTRGGPCEGHHYRQRQPGRGRGGGPHAARALPARGGRPDRDQRRLRHQLLRRVHGPARRASR